MSKAAFFIIFLSQLVKCRKGHLKLELVLTMNGDVWNNKWRRGVLMDVGSWGDEWGAVGVWTRVS